MKSGKQTSFLVKRISSQDMASPGSSFDAMFSQLLHEQQASTSSQEKVGTSQDNQSADGKSDKEVRSRARAFTSTDKELLHRIVATVDKRRILASCSRSADIRERKSRLWKEILIQFNNGSGREEEVTQKQLMNFSKSIKKGARERADEEGMKRALDLYKKDCSKTGGGVGLKEPPNDYVTSDEEEEEDASESKSISDCITNNLGPVRPPVLPNIGSHKEAMQKLFKGQDVEKQKDVATGDGDGPKIPIKPLPSSKGTRQDNSTIDLLKKKEICEMKNLIMEQRKTQRLQQYLLHLQIQKEQQELMNRGLTPMNMPDDLKIKL